MIFDTTLTHQSQIQIQRSLINRGYLHAEVFADTLLNKEKRKAKVIYRVVPGPQYRLSSVNYEFSDTVLRRVVMADSAQWPVQPGKPLDLNVLDAQRTMIATRLRNSGYFAFLKTTSPLLPIPRRRVRP